MKFLRIFLLLIPVSSAIFIHCNLTIEKFNLLGNLSTCLLENDPSIKSPNTIITETNVNHSNQTMNNSNVQAFAAVNKTIHYMPHGLNKIFQNINAIVINSCKLKEIHKADLQQFPNLKSLNLLDNEITKIERNLFKFNNDLKILKLKKNKIKEIYPTVFDNLYQLEWLGIKENECINDVKNNRAGVLELINIAKEQCMPDLISEINKLDNINDNQKEAVKSLKNENEQRSSVISALETKIGNLSKSQNKMNFRMLELIKSAVSSANYTQKQVSDIQKFFTDFPKFIREQKILIIAIISLSVITFSCLFLSEVKTCCRENSISDSEDIDDEDDDEDDKDENDCKNE